MLLRFIFALIFAVLVEVCGDLATSGPVLEFSLPHNDIFVFSNATLVIACKPPSNSVGYDVKWLGPRDERITPSGGRLHVEEFNDDGSLHLIFNNIEDSDRGIYTCKANVNGETASRSFRLHVQKRITFVDTPPVQTATEGDDFMIRCVVEGDPKPLVYWKFKYTEDERFRETEEGLFVTNVSRKDAGDYKCNAMQQNAYESDLKYHLVRLVVKYKPEFKFVRERKVLSYISGSANLSCEAHAEPAPEFHWYHAETRVDDDVTGGQYSVVNTRERSVLEVSIFNKSDFGKYTCRASNEIGTIEKNVTVEEAVRPSVPKVTVKASHVDSFELDIVPSSDGGLKVSGFQVQYKLEEEVEDVWHEDMNLLRFMIGSKYVVEKLAQGETYQVRVAAINEAGLSDFCDPMTVRTLKLHQADLASDHNNNSTAAAAIVLTWPHLVTVLTLVFGPCLLEDFVYDV